MRLPAPAHARESAASMTFDRNAASMAHDGLGPGLRPGGQVDMNRTRATSSGGIVRKLVVAAAGLMLGTTPAQALPPVSTPLTALSVSATTGEKPQSKVWTHDGRWWCVMP